MPQKLDRRVRQGREAARIWPCCPPGAPLSGLTPAQRELRRRVLDAVSAPTTKLAYGHVCCFENYLAQIFGR